MKKSAQNKRAMKNMRTLCSSDDDVVSLSRPSASNSTCYHVSMSEINVAYRRYHVTTLPILTAGNALCSSKPFGARQSEVERRGEHVVDGKQQ